MDNEQRVNVEIEISQMKLKLEPILKLCENLTIMEAASLVSTIAGRMEAGMTEKWGEHEFAYWWFTVNKGIYRSIPEGKIKVEARMHKEKGGN